MMMITFSVCYRFTCKKVACFLNNSKDLSLFPLNLEWLIRRSETAYLFLWPSAMPLMCLTDILLLPSVISVLLFIYFSLATVLAFFCFFGKCCTSSGLDNFNCNVTEQPSYLTVLMFSWLKQVCCVYRNVSNM